MRNAHSSSADADADAVAVAAAPGWVAALRRRALRLAAMPALRVGLGAGAFAAALAPGLLAGLVAVFGPLETQGGAAMSGSSLLLLALIGALAAGAAAALAAGVGVAQAARQARTSQPDTGAAGPGPSTAPDPRAVVHFYGRVATLGDRDGVSPALFMALAQREWVRARRHGGGAALLLVEIDRYARLQSLRGTAAVETVLTVLARHTVPTLRGTDALTRITASRMAVFVAPADAIGALDVAERVRELAEQTEVRLPPDRVRFSVSIGVALLQPAHLTLQALFDDAGAALAAAGAAGGNCVRATPAQAAQPRRSGAA